MIVSMDGDSLKARLLRRGRATLTVQTETAPYRYVSVEGPVTVAPEDRDFSMASRYLGPEMAGGMPTTIRAPIRPSSRLTPERWRSADFSKSFG